MADEYAQAKDAILKMSFAEISRYLNEMSISVPMPVYSALTQRLYEIALYDHHVPVEQRREALEYLDTVKAIVESGFKEKPDALTYYRAGNREMEDGARKCGIGTLAWLIEENGISSDDELVRFLARPESGPLLEEYFATLGPELATQLKQEVERISKLIL